MSRVAWIYTNMKTETPELLGNMLRKKNILCNFCGGRLKRPTSFPKDFIRKLPDVRNLWKLLVMLKINNTLTYLRLRLANMEHNK